MSIASWAREYLPPITEEDLESDIAAAKHCMHHWVGALPENLLRHGCKLKDCAVVSGQNQIVFDYENCALCMRYSSKCERCVLRKLGDSCGSVGSSYSSIEYGNPLPMIERLQRLIDGIDK